MAKSKGQISFGEALRRSGLPLEYAVGQMLPKIGRILPKGRYYYEVDSKTCETDIWALSGDSYGSIAVENALFIECKHRARDKLWCFLPQAQNVVDLSQNAFFMDLIGDKHQKRMNKLQTLTREIIPNIPVVGDGIELFINDGGNWETNPTSISDAIRQAIMPIGNYIRYVLLDNFVLSYDIKWIKFILPIVVTTAQIQILKRESDWSRLEVFEKIEECFEPTPAVICAFSTPDYVINYWRQSMEEYAKQLFDNHPNAIEKSIFLTSLGETSQEVASSLSAKVVRGRPTRALIVELGALEKTLKEYLSEVEKTLTPVLPKRQ
jgi:hypothetical protein